MFLSSSILNLLVAEKSYFHILLRNEQCESFSCESILFLFNKREIQGERHPEWPTKQVCTNKSKFNIPRISFCYLASHSPTLDIQIMGTMKWAIDQLSQLLHSQLLVFLPTSMVKEVGVVNHGPHHQNHE